MAAVYPLMMRQGKTKSKILQSFQASLAVNLVLFPVMLSFYYEFPPYSLLLNLVIIPLMSVVLGAGLLGSFLCLFFKPAGGVVFLLCRGILNLYEWSCNLSMKLPPFQAPLQKRADIRHPEGTSDSPAQSAPLPQTNW